MDDSTKLVLTIMVIVYVLSPVDFCIGPIDDIIVIMLNAAIQRRLGSGES